MTELKILSFCSQHDINGLDIPRIKRVALLEKEYDIIVYINNHTKQYLDFVKQQEKDSPLGF